MKIFKKFDSRSDKLFFGGCTHNYHQRSFIFTPRGFNTWQEHTDFILKALYNLPADSTFVFLGDFALNTTKEQIKSVLDTVKCQIVYIHGNHESAPDQIIKDIKTEWHPELVNRDIWPIKYNTTTFLGHCGAIQVDNQYIYLQHMAQYIWPYQADNSWHLCSHSHSNAKELNPQEPKFGKILDAGVDNALKYNNGEYPFFSWLSIKHIMDNKQMMLRDHHGNK